MAEYGRTKNIILRVLNRKQTATDPEIEQLVTRRYKNPPSPSRLRTARHELREAGFVRPAGKDGRVNVWQLTPQGRRLVAS